MPNCPYHGNPHPCRECLVKGMGQFAHAHPRGGRCPYHDRPHPCVDCLDRGMGRFARPSGTPIPAPPAPRYVPPHRRHTHGTQRPCKIRCGVNEGLYIRNDERNVTHLFTDSLINCAQVIFRNRRATFTCHILGGARQPRPWTQLIYRTFVERYGRVARCLVVTGGDAATGLRVISYLPAKLKVVHWPGCGGCRIRLVDGHVDKTPSNWNPSRPDVAGWLTAGDLIDLRLTGAEWLGEVSYGDYYEPCRACNL